MATPGSLTRGLIARTSYEHASRVGRSPHSPTRPSGLGSARLVQAYYWLAVAGQQGDDVAQDQLKKVGAGMTSDQIKDAENQAKEWMAKAKKVWNPNPK